jgi:hypothetical protein
VNGIELLLHVVGSEEVSDTSKLQQQVILETEDGRRADNSGLREKLSGNLLSSTLCSVELGDGLRVGAVGGNVDISVDIVLANSLDNSLSSLNVHILQREVLGRIVAANQVENGIGMSNARLDRRGVSKVVLNEDNTAKISSDLEMTLGHLLAVGNNDSASLAGQSVDNVSS